MKPLITKTTSACLSIFRGKSTDSIIEEQFKYYIDNGNTSNFGKAIIALNKQLKKGDKVLSFITGNYYFSRDAVVFSGNGSNTLPSRFGIPKPLYEFDSYGEFENTLISNGFTYMVINPGFLCLSKDEERVILSYIKNRHADSTIDDILIYRLC
jgi:hypothetical protein